MPYRRSSNHSGGVTWPSLAVFIYGIVLLTAPHSRYQSPGFDVCFWLMPQRAWGIVFLTVAMLAYFVRHHWTVALVGMIITLWALGLAGAALANEEVSPTAWIWSGTVCAVFWTEFVRFGPPPRRRLRVRRASRRDEAGDGCW